MNCLTKISLFFLVLSTVCDVSYSDRKAECSANLRLIFYNGDGMQWQQAGMEESHILQDVDPYTAFKLGMFALSEQVISDLTNTEELANSLIDQYQMFYDSLDEFELQCFIIVPHNIGDVNIEFTNSAIEDISGYFNNLIRHISTFYDMIVQAVKSPLKYCDEECPDKEKCRNALKIMFQKNDNQLNQMDGEDAFNSCYLNYRYLDFFENRIVSVLASRGSNSSNTITNDLIEIMKAYFLYLMRTVNTLVVIKRVTQPEIFESVDYYCEYR